MSDLSTLFEVLADDDRRRILYMLCETETLRVPEGLQLRGHVRARQSGGDGAMRAAQYDGRPSRAFESGCITLTSRN